MSKKRKPFHFLQRGLDYVVYILARGALVIIRHLPRRFSYSMARGLAQAAFWLFPKHRDIILTNLLVAMPNIPRDQAKHVVLNTFTNIGRVAVELSRVPLLKGKIRADSTGLFHVSENVITTVRGLLSRGKGLLYLTAHFGVWELLPSVHALVLPDVPLSIVVRPLDNPWLDQLVNGLRSTLGIRMLPKKNSIREILAALGRNEAVGILLDQNVCREEGVFVDFFGKDACTNFGLAAVALRTGTPVLPIGLFYDEAAGVHRVAMESEVPLIRTGNKAQDIQHNTAAFTRALETMIRKYPDQWLWVHRRWKTRPVDQAEKIYT